MPNIENFNIDVDIDSNTYWPSGNITAYPASNSVDKGKLYSEYNGRRVTINIVDRNYVVEPNPGGYDLSFSNGKINIAPGLCMINGFAVQTDSTVSYRLPTASEIVSEGYYKGYALLCLHTLFDAMDNLGGNVQVGSVWYYSGICVEYTSYEDYTNNPNDYLLLGGVDEEGNIKPNDDKYTRIDAKYIFVEIESDPETGAPPDQTTNLFDFINNFLHGYWVSKAGDNEYGSILFKSEPSNYFEEDFDYKTEDPLTSKKFGVKILNSTDDTATNRKGVIIVKPETENNNNMINQIIPGRLDFYKGTFTKGDVVNENQVEESIVASGFILPSSIYNSTNLIKVIAKTGAVRLDNTNVVFSAESAKAEHNGIEQGNTVYATNSISDTDVSTNHTNISYLYDSSGRIKNVNTTNNRYVCLDAKNNVVLINDANSETTVRPNIKLNAGSGATADVGIIEISNINFAKGSNNSAWRNILELHDNVKITSKTDSNNLGSLQATGFIVAGTQNNPATIQVPDIANSGGMRPLKSGDIYGTQVWSAVYNDIAEIFDVSDNLVGKEIVKLLLAVDENNPKKCVLADKQHKCVVGVVSENPAFCAGGIDCKNGVPVALAGRVDVKYEGKKPKIGDFVGVSNKTPGYVTKCRYNNKYRCGKIIDIIDKSTVKIIIL